ncbi:MAG: DUF1573 domain-containing protein, partial [Bacteroidia bacterium]|nr:DUF1573 domain-containing protein [Bacteroidia bacterium]
MGISFNYAQAPKIKFQTTEHDFGTISEGTQAKFTFSFENISKESVKLQKVQASCGCTTPSYTQEAVAPGQKGSIEVNYNSEGRPGPFDKSITVVYDTALSPVILRIRGTVTPKATDPSHDHAHDHAGHEHAYDHNHAHEQAHQPSNQPTNPVPVASAYPDTIGNLAFDRMAESVPVFKTDMVHEFAIKVKNIGKTVISFTDKSEFKPMFSLSFSKKTLKAGEEGQITIKADGKKAEACGLTNNAPFNLPILINTTDKASANKAITFSGFYQKVWTPEELANAPKITFEKTEMNGGQIFQGEKLQYQFKFTNTGKQDLVIESVKASCGCTATAPEEKVVKPGQSSVINATFDS